jgi:atlastin
VRDWSFPYEVDYGAKGGEVILIRKLIVSDEQHLKMQSLNKHIMSCFSDISCFLMPHPGFKVATNPDFEGELSDIEPDFKKQFHKLVLTMLAPANLVVKEISGQEVKTKELLHYFKSYLQIYKRDELPEPNSVLVARAQAINRATVAAATETYTALMERVCGGGKPCLSTAHLEAEHRRIKDESLNHFINKLKMRGKRFPGA